MRIRYFFLFLALFFVGSTKANNPPEEEGKAIFISRCASCHNINKTVTGPALAGVEERRSMDWIIRFVHSSQSMVKEGDKEAIALFAKFNKIPMPDHLDLTQENIKNILAYIKSEAKPATETKAPFAKPSMKKPNYVPISIEKDYWFLIGILVADLLLIATLLLAVKVHMMKKQVNNKVLHIEQLPIAS